MGYSEEKAQTGSKLDSKFFLESYLRNKLKKEEKALNEAERALAKVRRALPDTWFADRELAKFGAVPKQEFFSALNKVRDEISLRRACINREGLSRNYGSNKNEIVRAVLPILSDAGYHNRDIALMLAKAMSEVAEDVQASREEVQSLTVTIGNIQKERKEEGYKKSIPFLYP